MQQRATNAVLPWLKTCGHFVLQQSLEPPGLCRLDSSMQEISCFFPVIDKKLEGTTQQIHISKITLGLNTEPPPIK